MVFVLFVVTLVCFFTISSLSLFIEEEGERVLFVFLTITLSKFLMDVFSNGLINSLDTNKNRIKHAAIAIKEYLIKLLLKYFIIIS